MLTRETKILGWARRHRYAALALIAACALLVPTIAVTLSSRLPNETFIAADIIGTSTITTPSYVITGGTAPTITVCTTDPPTAIAPIGSLCLDTIPTPSTLYQSQGAGSWTTVGGAAATPTVGQFGDASDGDTTIAVNTTLTHDTYYHNLTVNPSTTETTAGYKVFVAGTLTLNGTISNAGSPATNGTGVSPGTGGVGAAGNSTGCPGQTGGTGGNNGGASGGNSSNPCPRGLGVGGAGGGDTGAAAGGSCVVDNTRGDIRDATGSWLGVGGQQPANRWGCGPGGGGGASPVAGCGGGGGGGGGGYLYVAARHWTGSGTLTVIGGAGGTSCTSGTAQSGGGGGGAGGVLVFKSLDATHPTEITAGGAGGAGTGVGTGGPGATGSSGIAINLIGN